MEWCVCMCVNCRKKTLVLWDIYVPWESPLVLRLLLGRKVIWRISDTHEGNTPRFDVNLFEWAKITVFNI